MGDYIKFTKKLSALSADVHEEELETMVLKGNGKAKKHLVGRDSDLCTWVLNDKSASRRHAVIAVRQDKRCITLRDNKSSFGVYLNKKRLPPGKTVQIKKRDQICFGKSPNVWVVADTHFLSEAELVGMDEAGIRAYLFVLGLRQTRSISRPDDFVPLPKLLQLHAGVLKNYRYEPIKYLNAVSVYPNKTFISQMQPLF